MRIIIDNVALPQACGETVWGQIHVLSISVAPFVPAVVRNWFTGSNISIYLKDLICKRQRCLFEKILLVKLIWSAHPEYIKNGE